MKLVYVCVCVREQKQHTHIWKNNVIYNGRKGNRRTKEIELLLALSSFLIFFLFAKLNCKYEAYYILIHTRTHTEYTCQACI